MTATAATAAAGRITGIDISAHQGLINFDAVAAAGHQFVICKATEGREYVDGRFIRNWRELSRRTDLYRGAYHFARPDSVGGAADGRAEAEDFCDALEALGGYGDGCLPPVLDFEKYSDDGAAENVPWIRAWVDTVEARLGRTPMIYTGVNVWRYETGNSADFTDLPLWLVQYGTHAQPSLKTLPWKSWAFWQWSGGGRHAHAPRTDDMVVDVNYFNGDAYDLAALARAPHFDPKPNPSKLLALMERAEHQIELALTDLRTARDLLGDLS